MVVATGGDFWGCGDFGETCFFVCFALTDQCKVFCLAKKSNLVLAGDATPTYFGHFNDN